MVRPASRPAAQSTISPSRRLEIELASARYWHGVLLLDRRDFKEEHDASFAEVARIRIQINEARNQAESALRNNLQAEFQERKKLVEELDQRMASCIDECSRLMGHIDAADQTLRRKDEEIRTLESQVYAAIQLELR